MVASPIALSWEHYTNMENLFWNSSLVHLAAWFRLRLLAGRLSGLGWFLRGFRRRWCARRSRGLRRARGMVAARFVGVRRSRGFSGSAQHGASSSLDYLISFP